MAQSVTVCSVPAGHPYVERILDSGELRLLPDPRPAGAPEGQWWPPVVLSPGWVEEHRDEARLLHLHFGFESFASADLVEVVDAAHRVGWPVVLTVHDLVNPQLADQAPHLERLGALVPAVDALITLTAGAAAAVEARWGRRPLVLPHPRLLADDAPPAVGFPRPDRVVGVHLKDLRPNIDGPLAVATLLGALDGLRDRGLAATGEVHLHRHVRDEEQRAVVRELCAARADVVLLEHERFDDESLANSLSHLDACLLPYRSGTHSGWLELCWDLGVAVAAPEVGFFREQHDDPTVASFAWEGGGSALSAALARVLAAAPPAGTPERRRLVANRREARAVTDAATVEAHVDLYRRLLAGREVS